MQSQYLFPSRELPQSQPQPRSLSPMNCNPQQDCIKFATRIDDKQTNEMIDFGFDRKNRKKMWEYDWTLLIPETHKEIGSMF